MIQKETQTRPSIKLVGFKMFTNLYKDGSIYFNIPQSGKLTLLKCLIFGFLTFISSLTNAQSTWTKIYETVTPSRDASGNIVYTSGFGKTGGAASSFSGCFNRVRYRMENNVAGNLRIHVLQEP